MVFVLTAEIQQKLQPTHIHTYKKKFTWSKKACMCQLVGSSQEEAVGCEASCDLRMREWRELTDEAGLRLQAKQRVWVWVVVS